MSIILVTQTKGGRLIDLRITDGEAVTLCPSTTQSVDEDEVGDRIILAPCVPALNSPGFTAYLKHRTRLANRPTVDLTHNTLGEL